MSISTYNLELDRIIREVKSRGAKSVIVQAPDGLKPYMEDLLRELSSAGVTTYISADPCYGGCSLADGTGRLLEADMLIHIGHNKFNATKEEIPTLYISAFYLTAVDDLIARSADFLKARSIKKVGLVASLQHLHNLRSFMEGLKAAGLDVFVDEVSGGLVLGCNVEGAKRVAGFVEAILHIGGGDFHALGVAMAVDIPVYIADPYRGEVRDIERLKRRVIARRWWAIEEAKRAKTFGVVVVGKKGQFKKDFAIRLKKELEERGREVVMVVADDVSWERLSGFTFVDAFIITGCPRISLDNQESFGKPVLNEEDAAELLRVTKK